MAEQELVCDVTGCETQALYTLENIQLYYKSGRVVGVGEENLPTINVCMKHKDSDNDEKVALLISRAIIRLFPELASDELEEKETYWRFMV